MKVLCYTVAIALHLSSVLGQSEQVTETLLQRELAERMEDAPFANNLGEHYERDLSGAVSKYGSIFFMPLINGFCRSPGNSNGRYESKLNVLLHIHRKMAYLPKVVSCE